MMGNNYTKNTERGTGGPRHSAAQPGLLAIFCLCRKLYYSMV